MIRLSSSRWALLAVLILTALPARAGETTHRFAFERKAGERIRETSVRRLDLFLRTDDDARGYQVSFERKETSETTVVEAEGGKPTRVERAFETCKDVTDCSALSGRMERVGFAQGKNFLLEKGDGGLRIEVLRSTEGEGELPPALQERFRGEMDRAVSRLFPTEAVKTGHTWTREGKDLLALVPGLEPEKLREAKAAFKLVEISSTGDVPAAVVEVTTFALVVDGGEAGAKLTLTGKGTLKIHASRGWILAQKLEGKAKLDAPLGVLKGEGSFEIEGKTEEIRR
jgi:hypothetical protein